MGVQSKRKVERLSLRIEGRPCHFTLVTSAIYSSESLKTQWTACAFGMSHFPSFFAVIFSSLKYS